MNASYKTVLAVTACVGLAACSDGTAQPVEADYDETLACYTTLMGVSAVNRENGGEAVRGSTSALMTLRTAEMNGEVDEQKVKEDLHAASGKVQDIVALAKAPDGAAEFAKLEAEAEACSEIYGD